MNHKYMNGSFNECRKNLIEKSRLSEDDLDAFDQFMGILRGDIPAPVVCDLELEICERKRIFEQFVRGFEEAGVYEW